jgi:hypothetical protein
METSSKMTKLDRWRRFNFLAETFFSKENCKFRQKSLARHYSHPLPLSLGRDFQIVNGFFKYNKG